LDLWHLPDHPWDYIIHPDCGREIIEVKIQKTKVKNFGYLFLTFDTLIIED